MTFGNTSIPGLTAEMLNRYRIFHPHAFKRTIDALTSNLRLVHYTSAETALSIFRQNAMWMRNASCMNDFREVEYGIDCFRSAFNKYLPKFLRVFNGLFPDFTEKLSDQFEGWLPHFRDDTYILCFSEHDPTENHLGRLSMWRAYGGTTGVAVVVNNGPFMRPSDALKAYTSPVAYLDQETFDQEFIALLDSVYANRDFVKSLGVEIVQQNMFAAFRAAVLCTKHPGFHEEREWRVIYSPLFQESERLVPDLVSIRGAPQPIFKIPLKDVPEEGLTGIELATLIDRIIIGPTQYPAAIKKAFVSMLEQTGVKDAQQRVIVSDIPLRV